MVVLAKNLVGLNEFETFDFERFLANKAFEACAEAQTLTDFDTGEVRGVKLTLEITEDRGPYRHEGVSNVGARFDLKIPGKDVSEYSWVGYRVPVELIDVVDATRWAVRQGGARNQLTVTGDVRKRKA